MNWRLILSLSMFGLFMAFGTVYFIPAKIEPICWLIIFVICAYSIAQNVDEFYFKHGFMVSIFNCVWITGVHIILSTAYIAHHAAESKQYVRMSAEWGLSLTQSMLIMGPIIGVISGVILGIFAQIASRVV
ncbi:MAG: hypothetical protein JWQ38_914 [Flavipsychrobacter sp.]|nr:hypothetical protein [Flavipsychrobacter sp.]